MNDRHGTGAIELAHVSKVFDNGRIRAVDDVSLSIEPREWVALVGPSGSGKSTLLHLLAALDVPDGGEIVVNGQPLLTRKDLNRYRREDVGLVFQLHDLLPNLTALQNVTIAIVGSGTHRREAVERARGLLADVGLAERESLRPPELSGGERQRVAIARALANGPSILLADEPTGSLDPESAQSVLELFARVRSERGLTILMVTHDRTVAAAADRIIAMRKGKIEHAPTPLTSSPPSPAMTADAAKRLE